MSFGEIYDQDPCSCCLPTGLIICENRQKSLLRKISPKLTESRRHAQFYLRGCLFPEIVTWHCQLTCVLFYDLCQGLVSMVTALLLSTVPGELTELQCIRTNQKFHHKFSVLNAWNLLKIMLKYPYLCLTLSSGPVLQNVNFFLEGTFSLEKWKSKWPTVRNMCFQKLWKILFFKTKHNY